MLEGKELAEAVLRHVLAHPEQHHQATWTNREYDPVDCGTKACLAGWAVILNAEPGETPARAARRLGGDFETAALTLLFPGGDVQGRMWGPGPVDRESPEYRVQQAFYTTGNEEAAIETFAGAFGLNPEDYR